MPSRFAAFAPSTDVTCAFRTLGANFCHAAPAVGEDVYLEAQSFDNATPAANSNFVVLSPDEGSVKRALRYQKKLNVNMAIVDKRRVSATQVESANLIGASLEGKVALIFDDIGFRFEENKRNLAAMQGQRHNSSDWATAHNNDGCLFHVHLTCGC